MNIALLGVCILHVNVREKDGSAHMREAPSAVPTVFGCNISSSTHQCWEGFPPCWRDLWGFSLPPSPKNLSEFFFLCLFLVWGEE